MSDLTTLYEAWEIPEPPSPAAHTRARAALLERATTPAPARGPRRRPRPGVRLALVGALALAVAAAVVVVENLGDDRLNAVPTASAEVLERAASVAEDKPFTAPRPHQWIYIEERFSGTDGTRAWHSWHRADGLGLAWLDEQGKLRLRPIERPRTKRNGVPIPGPVDSYGQLAALPTEPDALLSWAYDQAKNITGGGTDDDGDVYLLFNHMMRDNLLPPALEAGLFRALKQVPGVTVDRVELSGRPVLSLGLDTASWLHEELLLDERTYTYRGERSTVTRDAKIDPLKAGNATGEMKKGHVVVVERLGTAIVDEAGERG